MPVDPQDDIVKKFKSEIETIFQIPVTEWGYGFDFHTSTGSSNYSFRKSKYFEDPTGKKYFHLTTYRNFLSIINSGALRLYNILNSKDENELNTYANRFGQNRIKSIKEHAFTFSCCEIEAINDSRLWKEYGQVAIVFEFINDARKWDDFHFAKVTYKNDESSFYQYFDLVEKYSKQYDGIDFYFETAPKLAAFYKVPELSWEQETRLLFMPRPSQVNQMTLPYDFRTSNYHTGITQYTDVPLYVDEKALMGFTRRHLRLRSKFQNDGIPHIRITSIIFGDNDPLMTEEKFQKIEWDLRYYIGERLGYRDFEFSNHLFETGAKE